MFQSLSECTALCKKFRCDRKPSPLKTRRQKENKQIWCTWVDDECDGPWCKYGICMDRRMTSDGKCKGLKKPAEPRQFPEHYGEFDSKTDEDLKKKFSKQIGSGKPF